MTDARDFSHLNELLSEIHDSDPSRTPPLLVNGEDPYQVAERMYAYRNALVYQLLSQAFVLDLPHGVRPDPQDADWVIAYVDLPAGQVSWHLPAYPNEWDGHDTTEKYRRVRACIFEHPGLPVSS